MSDEPSPAAAGPASRRFGVVVIGRNEGERLLACLRAIDPTRSTVVYVDSGSTDGSPEQAAALGARVVALDMATPFTAARARNAGWRRLAELDSAADYVQFVDGDCELDPAWLERAAGHLDANPRCVAVSGRLRERYPERSVYNALSDVDWSSTPGDARSFAGNVMLRMAPLHASGGYDPTLIAGEEPELAIRLRRQGWSIRQTDWPMALHDADIHTIGAWWRRAMRTGYAYAQGAAMYGDAPERHWMRERWSAVFWGLALPVMVASATLASWRLALALLAAYPLQMLRLAVRSRLPPRLALALGLHRVLNKFPEMLGVLRYVRSRHRRTVRPIEYK